MKGRNTVKGGKSKAAKRSAKPMPARPAKVRPAARGKRAEIVGLNTASARMHRRLSGHLQSGH